MAVTPAPTRKQDMKHNERERSECHLFVLDCLDCLLGHGPAPSLYELIHTNTYNTRTNMAWPAGRESHVDTESHTHLDIFGYFSFLKASEMSLRVLKTNSTTAVGCDESDTVKRLI